ncbi:MAG: hypothetical protein M5U25_20625 [Planctomycetota bacterium]|nr:hypothetical protein [Planctomycetota bacterium]
MRTSLVLCLALITLFALAACGGGDNTSNTAKSETGSTNTEDKKAEPAAKTPAEERQAVAERMANAMAALDADAVLAVFHKDEHELVEKRICTELRGMKDEGVTITMQKPTIEEVDGKFFATFVQTIALNGESEEDTKKLSIIEKDGKFYMSFTK